MRMSGAKQSGPAVLGLPESQAPGISLLHHLDERFPSSESPHGPECQLELQPSQPHSRQLKGDRKGKGAFLAACIPFKKFPESLPHFSPIPSALFYHPHLDKARVPVR